jgi:hypothetical protein
MPLLVKRIYTYCLLQLNQTIPDSLSADIMNDIDKFMQWWIQKQEVCITKIEQISSQLGDK